MGKEGFRIEICGAIAAGKTTLSGLVHELEFFSIHEEFAVNPFLTEFYKRPDLYSFETEITFLLQHYHSIKKSWGKYGRIICDYSFILDQAYADLTLTKKNEQDIFLSTKFEILRQLSHPDLLIYLTCNPTILYERIVSRGRQIEKEITVDFLENLTIALEKRVMQSNDAILVIESDKFNFAQDILHRQYVIALIKNKIFNLISS